MTIPSNQLKTCFICSKEVDQFETGELEDKNLETCHRFFTLVSRYLNFHSESLSHHLTLNIKNDGNFLASAKEHRRYTCDVCFPHVQSFCDMYELLHILQLELSQCLDNIANILQTIPPVKTENGEIFPQQFLTKVKKKRKHSFPQLVLQRISKGQLESTSYKSLETVVSNISDNLENIQQSCFDDDNQSTVSRDSFPFLNSPPARETQENSDANVQDEEGAPNRNKSSSHTHAQETANIQVQDDRTSKLISTFSCLMCDKLFHKEETFLTHLKMHTKEKTFVCKECMQEFMTQHELVCHRRKHSPTNFPLKCDHCGDRFAWRCHLNRHKKRHQPKTFKRARSRKLKCSFCDKQFDERRRLKEHENVHTGNKPYQCKFCFKKFTAKATANRHERFQHAGKKPYPCDKCSMAFISEKDRRDHENSKHTGAKPFVCQYCQTRFSSMVNHRRHEQNHNGEFPPRCKFCAQGFLGNATREQHEATKHADETPGSEVKCRFCHQCFPSLALYIEHEVADHVTSHGCFTVVECRFCTAILENEAVHETHVRMHVEQEQLFKCDQCELRFSKRVLLDRHVAKIHKVGSGELIKAECQFCKEIFIGKDELNQHVEIHAGEEKPYTCQFCDESFRSHSDLETHEKTHSTEEIHKCSICGMEFRSLDFTRLHEKCHEPEDGSLQCRFCPFTSGSQTRFQIHKRYHHHTDRKHPYTCEDCGKGFVAMSNLTVHKKTHNKTFLCGFCGKGFPTAGTLNSHELSHSSEGSTSRQKQEVVRNFTCEICGKMFIKLHNLNAHVIMHTSGGKQLNCEICKKTFSQRSALNRHRRLHFSSLDQRKIFECKVCKVRLTTKFDLTRHMGNHTGVKKFTCQFCGKGFARKTRLHTHEMAIHTNDKPFLCFVCGKAFISKHQQNLHEKRMHQLEKQ